MNAPGPASASLAAEFRRYFGLVPAVDDDLKRVAYQIRYQVYAEELGWEDAGRFQDRQETDAFDARAESCLLRHLPSGQYVGCVRLVRSDTAGVEPFPFELAIAAAGQTLELPVADAAWRQRAGEISRVAVIAQFRRRRDERGRPDTSVEDDAPASPERRVFPHIAIGLYLGAAALGLMRGLDGVFAIMEPRLARRLRVYGIEFEPVGEGLEHHGLRVPYVLSRERFEQSVAPPIRDLLDKLRADLAG